MTISREYRLRCCGCGAIYEDDGTRLVCASDHPPALLRTVYDETSFRPGATDSVLRYAAWLPRGRDIATGARIGVYRSRGLGPALGLTDLWIAFCGWWPERGARLRTATFKELEAISVLARLAPDERRTLVVASAGNTAAAFADACTVNDVPILIVIPQAAWPGLAAIVPEIGPSVKIVALADAIYDDAIAFAGRLAATGDFVLEGGVRNVARRDGLGTVMLAAAEAIGGLPAAYVQGVGSAAGALGATEAAHRLIGDGGFGTTLPRLVLAQNAPFSPIVDAWRMRSFALPERTVRETRAQLATIEARVLSNQAPPYAVPGGVREALVETDGRAYAVGNDEVVAARARFEREEGADIDAEAAVATAALVRAVADGTIDRARPVLLNVTGGGRAARCRPSTNAPALLLDRAAVAAYGVERVRALFSPVAT